MNALVNILIYQVIWFLCVIGETRGAILAIPLLGLHLFFTQNRKNDLQLMAAFFVAGLVIDGSLYGVGFFSFEATLPHNSLGWLKGRPFLSALFGATGGPLAYWAGVRLGAASFNWPLVPSLLLLAAIWALLWPGAMHLAGKAAPDFGRFFKKPG